MRGRTEERKAKNETREASQVSVLVSRRRVREAFVTSVMWIEVATPPSKFYMMCEFVDRSRDIIE